MGKPIINGTLSPIRQPYEIDFDPVRGLVVNESFEGAGDGLGGLANTYLNRNVAFRWKRGATRSSIVATYSGGQNGLPDNSQANWQLLANEIQKSIYEHPIALAVEDAFPGTLDIVRRDFDLLSQGEPVGSPAPNAGAVDNYNTLISLLRRGTTHFALGQYVLKRTYSVSNYYVGDLPGEGYVECLITTAELLSGLPIPPVISRSISSIPTPYSHAGYLWSWRQLPTTIVTNAQNRADVSTEWWFEEWSTDLYLAV